MLKKIKKILAWTFTKDISNISDHLLINHEKESTADRVDYLAASTFFWTSFSLVNFITTGYLIYDYLNHFRNDILRYWVIFILLMLNLFFTINLIWGKIIFLDCFRDSVLINRIKKKEKEKIGLYKFKLVKYLPRLLIGSNILSANLLVALLFKLINEVGQIIKKIKRI